MQRKFLDFRNIKERFGALKSSTLRSQLIMFLLNVGFPSLFPFSLFSSPFSLPSCPFSPSPFPVFLHFSPKANKSSYFCQPPLTSRRGGGQTEKYAPLPLSFVFPGLAIKPRHAGRGNYFSTKYINIYPSLTCLDS